MLTQRGRQLQEAPSSKAVRVCTKDHCGLLFVAGQRVLRTEAGRAVRQVTGSWFRRKAFTPKVKCSGAAT